MKKKLSVTITFLLILFSASSQNKKIEGTVLNLDKTPIDYATVVLQNSDSSYVDYILTDSAGRFSFNKYLTAYRLVIQHVSFLTKEIDISFSENNLIYLDPNILEADQVIVKGERPLVKVINGIITYDVEQVIKNRSISTAYDAVLALPGVMEQNENILLAGSNGVTIILNGKPTTMSHAQLITLLKQMPSSYIEKAEIMYSTPPQYKVRGAAINLVTRNAVSETGEPLFQGEVNGAYIQRKDANYTAGATLLYASKKMSVDALYSFYDQQSISDLDLLSKHNLDGKTYDIAQYNKGNNKSQIHTARLGIDYKLSETNVLSLVYNTAIHANGIAKQLSTGNFSTSQTFNREQQQLHNVALDYTSDSGFKAGVNYTSFTSLSTQIFENIDNSGSESKFTSDAKQNINAFMLYVDKSHTLKKGWGLTYGAKFNHTNDYSFQIFDNMQGDVATLNTNNTIRESIFDLYAGTSKSFTEKLSMNVSVTGEYYKFVEDEEITMFPQMQLTYLQSEKNIYQFSFSSNKQYPTYWEKQNYRSYINGYVEGQGNPNLKSFNNYSAQLAYIYKQKYVFALFSIYQPDYAIQLGYQSLDKLSFVYKTLNFDYDFKVGVNAVIPFRISSWFDSRLTVNSFYQRTKGDKFHDISFDNDKFIGYVASDNTFNISSKPNIKMEVSAYYMTAPIQGIYNLSQIYNVNAGFKWTLKEQNMEFRLRATDIFESSTPSIYVKESLQNYDMFVNSDSRIIQFSFRYKFGGYKSKERKEINTSRFGQ